MKKRQIIIIAAMFAGFLAAGLTVYWNTLKPTVKPLGTGSHSNESPLYEAHDKAMNIFVKGLDRSSGWPYNTTTTIRQSRSRYNQMKQALLAYLGAARSEKLELPVPEGMALGQFYFTPDGEAVVDLSTAQVNKEHFGFYEELVFIRGLIEVLSRNFFEIKQVKILVDGQDAPTLAGHYALGTNDAPPVAQPASGKANPKTGKP